MSSTLTSSLLAHRVRATTPDDLNLFARAAMQGISSLMGVDKQSLIQLFTGSISDSQSSNYLRQVYQAMTETLTDLGRADDPDLTVIFFNRFWRIVQTWVQERDPSGELVKRFIESFRWLVRAWNAGHLVDILLPAEFVCRLNYEKTLWVKARGVFKYAEHLALADNCFLPDPEAIQSLDHVGHIILADRERIGQRRALMLIISISLFVRAYVDIDKLLLWYDTYGKTSTLTRAEEEIFNRWMTLRAEDLGLLSAPAAGAGASSASISLSSFARAVYSQLRVLIAFAKVPKVPVLLQPRVTQSSVIQAFMTIRKMIEQLNKGRRLDEIGLSVPTELAFVDAFDHADSKTHVRFV